MRSGACWARGGPRAGSEQAKVPGTIAILVLALIVAALTVLVRNFSPVDHWTYILRFIKVAFADVPRDLAFFIVGVLAYRRGWFMRYPTRRGLIWLGVGAALGVLWYVYAMALQPRFPALQRAPVAGRWALLPVGGGVLRGHLHRPAGALSRERSTARGAWGGRWPPTSMPHMSSTCSW